MPQPFSGSINIDIRDSVPDWSPFEPVKAPDGAPNVVYIVLDDVGYSAMSCYAGPIETPNIDRIAASGVRYSQWHTMALCSPTRSSSLPAAITPGRESSSKLPKTDLSPATQEAVVSENVKARLAGLGRPCGCWLSSRSSRCSSRAWPRRAHSLLSQAENSDQAGNDLRLSWRPQGDSNPVPPP
jgi:Sulfatase